jgi:hypothetical protein
MARPPISARLDRFAGQRADGFGGFRVGLPE